MSEINLEKIVHDNICDNCGICDCKRPGVIPDEKTILKQVVSMIENAWRDGYNTKARHPGSVNSVDNFMCSKTYELLKKLKLEDLT